MNLTADSVITRITNTAINQRIPCILYIGCLFVLGTVGNIHVLIFFSRTKGKPSTYIVFVISLSIVDLIACVVNMPIEVVDLLKPYTFYSEVGCKLFRYNNAFILMSSVAILFLIALERYRRICNPLKKQMSVYLAKCLCILVILISLLITFPNYLITGHHIVKLKENGLNATGYMCFISDHYHGSTFLYCFVGFIACLFIIGSATLIVIYCSVLRVMFRRQATTSKQKQATSSGMRVDISTLSASGNICHYSQKQVTKTSKRFSLKDKNRLKTSTLKTTRTLIVITALFVVVFPSTIILYYVNGMDNEFKEKLSNLELTLYQIGVRLTLINNISNPFVYGFTDRRFQNGVKTFYYKNMYNK